MNRIVTVKAALAALVIASALAIAARPGAAAPATSALAGSFGGDIDLEADTISFSQSDGEFNTMVASGNVIMSSEGLSLQAESLTYDPVKETMLANAGPGRLVRVKAEGMEAECARLAYQMGSSEYVLSGGVRINQKGAVVTGEQIRITQQDDGKFQIKGDSGGRAVGGGGTGGSGRMRLSNAPTDVPASSAAPADNKSEPKPAGDKAAGDKSPAAKPADKPVAEKPKTEPVKKNDDPAGPQPRTPDLSAQRPAKELKIAN